MGNYHSGQTYINSNVIEIDMDPDDMVLEYKTETKNNVVLD